MNNHYDRDHPHITLDEQLEIDTELTELHTHVMIDSLKKYT